MPIAVGVSPPLVKGGASEDDAGSFLGTDAGDGISRGIGM